MTRVIIEVGSDGYRVWRESGGTVGPMMARMGAKFCRSQEEAIEITVELLSPFRGRPEFGGDTDNCNLKSEEGEKK